MKKLYLFVLISALTCGSAYSAQQTISVGTEETPVDLDTNFTNIQANMTELYNAVSLNTAKETNTDDQDADEVDDTSTTNKFTTSAEKATWNAKQDDLDVPSQAEAEAGSATTERVWTAQRVAQAIAALATGGSADDTAYDATSWDSNTDAATKNAIRDKIETLGSAGEANETMDSTPTEGNTDHTVSSDGLFDEFATKQDTLTNPLVRADLDTTPADDANAPISSSWAYGLVNGTEEVDGISVAAGSDGPQLVYFYEDSDNGSNYVGIGSPASNGNDLILLLPSSDPTTGQLLTCAAPTSVTFKDGVARDASVCSWSDTVTATSLSVDDLITLSGVSGGDVSLGTFTGATIADNQTNKQALQALETAVEAAGGHDAVTVGTANGLSLSTQELSLAAATNATPGAATAAQITALEAIDTFAEIEAGIDLEDIDGAVTDSQVPNDITITIPSTQATDTEVSDAIDDAQAQALVVSDLDDSTTPSVLTAAETTGRTISNYKSTGADHVFTLPTAHIYGQVIFVIGDEFQVDVEPPSGTALYLNGDEMASDEHIENDADTLAQQMVCFTASLNGTLRWMCESKYDDFAEATP